MCPHNNRSGMHCGFKGIGRNERDTGQFRKSRGYKFKGILPTRLFNSGQLLVGRTTCDVQLQFGVHGGDGL